MPPSHLIEIDGLFVAAAIRHDKGYRIVAIDPRLEALDGSICPTLEHAHSLAGTLIAVLPSSV